MPGIIKQISLVLLASHLPLILDDTDEGVVMEACGQLISLFCKATGWGGGGGGGWHS